MIYDSENLQIDITARLMTLEEISAVSVLRQQPGSTEAEVEEALSTLNSRAGKMGAVALVLSPTEKVTDADMPGPEIEATITVRIITNALLNTGADGTGLSNARIRRAVRRGLHHWSPTGATVVVADAKAGEPVEVGEGVECYDVEFTILLPEPQSPQTLPRPKIEISGHDGEFFTVWTGLNMSAIGADVWHSTDGSLPVPDGASSSLLGALYPAADRLIVIDDAGERVAPLPYTAGSTLRVAFYLPGRNGSSVVHYPG